MAQRKKAGGKQKAPMSQRGYGLDAQRKRADAYGMANQMAHESANRTKRTQIRDSVNKSTHRPVKRPTDGRGMNGGTIGLSRT